MLLSFNLTCFCVLYLERNALTARAWATRHNHLSQWLTFTTCAPKTADISLQTQTTAAQLYLTHTHTHTHTLQLVNQGKGEPRGSTWVSRDSAQNRASTHWSKTQTWCEILPVVSTVSQVMRSQLPWWSAGSMLWLSMKKKSSFF